MSEHWQVSPSEVALDLVADEDLSAVERLLTEDPEFAKAVAAQRELQDHLLQMPAVMRRPEPPPPLRMDAKGARTSGGWIRRWSFRPRALLAVGVVVASLAIAIVVVGSSEDQGGQPSPGAVSLTLAPVQGGGGRALLTVADGRARIVGDGLPPSARGHYYEAWLARNDGKMVPMGGFTIGEDGRVDVGMDLDEDLARFDYIDVSVERKGTTPKHAGEAVLRADL